MLSNTIRKPILEWLQLYPGLLSAAPRLVTPPPATQAPVAAQPPDATVEVALAEISTRTVQTRSPGMQFHQPDAAFPGTLGQTTTTYRSPGGGETHRAALAEMTGYLATGLQPR